MGKPYPAALDRAHDSDARAYLYTVLRILFHTPLTRQGACLALDAQTQEAFKVVLGTAGDGVARHLAETDIAAVAAGDPEATERLEGEFNRAFIGPDVLVAPPWESVYVNEDRSLLQASTLEVRRDYAAAGFAVGRKGRDIDDHVAIECEFLASLYGRAAEALSDGNEQMGSTTLTQACSFERDHLGRWAPAFADALVGKCPTYAAVATALRDLATAG